MKQNVMYVRICWLLRPKLATIDNSSPSVCPTRLENAGGIKLANLSLA